MPRSTPRFFTEYEESKAVAEREALELASRGLPVVIVHPTRVYGPGPLTEGNSVSLMIDQYDRGRFPALLDGGGNVGNYAFVDDVVEGHLLAMEKGRVGERYLLGGENVSLKGLFSLVDELTDRKHFQVSLPRSLALLYAGLEKRKAEWLGVYPKVTPGLGGDVSRRLGLHEREGRARARVPDHAPEGGAPPDARLAARGEEPPMTSRETTERPGAAARRDAVRPRPVGRIDRKTTIVLLGGDRARNPLQVLREQAVLLPAPRLLVRPRREPRS